MIIVADIAKKIHAFAPTALAYDWDNPGLQVGDYNQPVHKVVVALDVTRVTLDYAYETEADMIVSHHPLIFRKLKNVTDPFLVELIRNKIAVLSAHTNLDVTPSGVNHKLAERLGVKNVSYISTDTGASLFHVAVYVPLDYMEIVADAVFGAGAGRIGNYRGCGNEYRVQGRFEPLDGAKPTIGKVGRVQTVEEIKFEFFADSTNLNAAIQALRKAHPYEEPVYVVYPLNQQSSNYGLGLIGEIDDAMPLNEFAERVKDRLEAPFVRLWQAEKEQDAPVKKVALCGGSGSSLLSRVTGRADVFVSGDFTYHTLLDSRMPIIDAGHFYTEYPALEILQNVLSDCEVPVTKMPLELHAGSKLRTL